METCGPSSASGLMIALTRRAVGKACIHHRRRVVDAPADRGDDAVDHLQQVAVVLEPDVGLLQPAVPLDEDLLARCSPECRRSRVLDQRLQRSQAEDLVQDLADQRLTLVEVERDHLLGDQVVDDLPDRLDDLVPADAVQAGEVEPLDQPAVDPALDLLEVVRAGAASPPPSAVGRPRAKRSRPRGLQTRRPVAARAPQGLAAPKAVDRRGSRGQGERSRWNWRSFGCLLGLLHRCRAACQAARQGAQR